jgi:hypothetical protein
MTLDHPFDAAAKTDACFFIGTEATRHFPGPSARADHDGG